MKLPQRLVQLAKWLIGAALRVSGVLALVRLRRARRGEVAVLWFHRIDGTPEARLPMAVPPEAFRELVRCLSRRYTIAPWEACVRVSRERGHRPHVAITFDDGYRDNAETAWPILREAGASGVFLVTTSFLDGVRPLWWEVIAATHAGGAGYPLNAAGEATYGQAEPVISGFKSVRNERREEAVGRAAEILGEPIDAAALPRAFSWSDASRMVREGAEIGGHTVSHPILTRCTDEELERELGCRSTIQARTGIEVETFAYPNGSHDERVVEAVRAAGYRFAFTIEKGTYTSATDPLRIPRIGVSEPRYSLDGRRFSWTIFEAEMLGVFDGFRARARRGSQSGE